MLELAEHGKPHGGGPRPFGFDPDRVTLNDREAATVREMASRILAGESLISVTTWLQSSGVPTVSGTEWRTTTVRDLLLQPRIAGLRTHQGVTVGKAMWPPIITEEQHAQIVALLTDPSRRTNRTARRYLLSGVTHCAVCGTRMVSSPRNGRRRYICKSGADFGGCGGVTMSAEPVEELIAESVIQRLDSPELQATLEGRTRSDEATAALTAAIAADETRLDELAAAYANGDIPMRDWIKAGDVLRTNLTTKRRELSHRSGSSVLAGYIGQGSALRDAWATLNLNRQRAIVLAVVETVLIKPATRPGSHRPELSRIEVRWRL